jgi:hypothetical protein
MWWGSLGGRGRGPGNSIREREREIDKCQVKEEGMRQEGKGERYHLSPESWWGYRKAVEEEGRGYSDLRNLNDGPCSIHTRRKSSGICEFICTLTVLTVRTMTGLE